MTHHTPLSLARLACTLVPVELLAVAAPAQVGATDAQVEAGVLKALAGEISLAGEAITTRTDGGIVTLSGTVTDETRRVRAETLASRVAGVRRVVDELQLSSAGGTAAPAVSSSSAASSGADAARPLVLQSDGSYAPAEDQGVPVSAPDSAQQTAAQPIPGSAPAAGAQRNDPENDAELDAQTEAQQGGAQAPGAQQGAPPYGRRPLGSDGTAAAGQTAPQPGYPQQSYPQQGYPQNGRRYGYPPAYPPGYGSQGGQYGTVYGGQAGGQSVTIPAGSLLRVRVDRTLASDLTPIGTPFDGILVNDVVAGGLVAIPRGAAVQGTVVAAVASGTLKGRGEMSIALTSVTLGGRVYPIQSDVWNRHGGDKTIETVNKTAGFGAAGAVIGALAGGGVGAAVGGGIGAAAGLGSSAASGNGQVGISAESLVVFHLAQPAPVVTVSEAEMQRLAMGSTPAGMLQPAPRYRMRPRVYVGPGYYPPYGPYGPYSPYGYPAY